MRRLLALVTTAALAIVLATRLVAQPPVKTFQGYWMGIDPVDGGDARRSIVRLDAGRFAMVGRDSVLTLCDGTDRGLGSFDDGVVVGRSVLQSDNLTLRCFNSTASVVLKARYELVGNGILVEVTTTQDDTPVSTIVLHKVSQD